MVRMNCLEVFHRYADVGNVSLCRQLSVPNICDCGKLWTASNGIISLMWPQVHSSREWIFMDLTKKTAFKVCKNLQTVFWVWPFWPCLQFMGFIFGFSDYIVQSIFFQSIFFRLYFESDLSGPVCSSWGLYLASIHQMKWIRL